VESSLGGGGKVSSHSSFAALSCSIAIKSSLESGSECDCNSSSTSSSSISLKPTSWASSESALAASPVFLA
jgi:hypothetical protein